MNRLSDRMSALGRNRTLKCEFVIGLLSVCFRPKADVYDAEVVVLPDAQFSAFFSSSTKTQFARPQFLDTVS